MESITLPSVAETADELYKLASKCGIIGALVAFSFLFNFNPIWWLSLCIIIAGLVGSSRMLLRQHTLWQVLAGTFLGILLGFVGIILKF